MNRFNEELSRAGALLALDGLMPPATATRLTFTRSDRPTVTDGPFTEAKELVGGYWIIQARSQEEAVEWASRAPIGDGTIEVRQIAEAENFTPEVAEAARMSRSRRSRPCGVTARAATQRAIEAVWRIESARLIAGARADGARRRRSPRSSRRTRSSPRSRRGRRPASRTTRARG